MSFIGQPAFDMILKKFAHRESQKKSKTKKYLSQDFSARQIVIRVSRFVDTCLFDAV